MSVETAPVPTATGGDAPATIAATLLRHAAQRPTATALRRKVRGVWEEIDWATYAARVAHFAAGLRALGVRPGDRVAVHSENRVEWLIADLAVQGLGAQTVGIYPTSPRRRGGVPPAPLRSQGPRRRGRGTTRQGPVRPRRPTPPEAPDRDRPPRRRPHPAVLHFAAVERAANRTLAPKRDPASVPNSMLAPTCDHGAAAGAGYGAGAGAGAEYATAVAALEPGAAAIVVYTSGTTGPPKGALISHRNLVVAADAFANWFGADRRDELLSYLPLCHVAERLLSLGQGVRAGCVVNFGEGVATFAADLRDVQPTTFLGVPQVWEKMLAGVEIRMADASWLKRTLYRAAVARGRASANRRMNGASTTADRVTTALCDAVVFGALREKLGLSRVRTALSGAAPVAPQVLEWLWAIGVPVREGYGQTENTAVCTLTPPGAVRLGTVGVALPGVELRIAEDGEILTRSPGVFLGYLDDPAATAAAVDADGWLHTGDVGELDADGHLRIVDRKKDIIITAGGKNVSPSEIENRLKAHPYVREAVVVGDGRRYLTALVGIEADTVGDWATRRGIAYTTYADLSGKPEVWALVQTVVDEANAELAQVEQLKRFTLLTKELDHEDGELTATQKVKRAALAGRFATEIDAMYR